MERNHVAHTPSEDESTKWRNELDVMWRQVVHVQPPKWGAEWIWRTAIPLLKVVELPVMSLQEMSRANSLLYEYWRSGDEIARTQGQQILEDGVKFVRGLGIDNWLSIEACYATQLAGTAMQFMEAAHLSAQCGLEAQVYLSTGLEISAQVLKGAQHDVRQVDCAWLPPLLRAFQFTGEPAYLETAKEVYGRYAQIRDEARRTVVIYTDVRFIDKDTDLILVQTGLLLYKLSGEAQFLDGAVSAAYDLAAWYGLPEAQRSIENDSNEELLRIVIDWLELAVATRNVCWAERACIIWNTGMFELSDDAPYGLLTDIDAKRFMPSAIYRLEMMRRLDDWEILNDAAEQLRHHLVAHDSTE